MNELGLRFPIGCTFLGVNCSQSWADLLLWERFLNAHPEVKSIVELGTGEGGFSQYLDTQSNARGILFTTFDNVRPKKVADYDFQMCDVLEEPLVVAKRFKPPTVLFCDNGDKPREVRTYTPYLSKGDFVFVHDWGAEIDANGITPELKMMHEKWCNELHSPTRIFRKVS